MFLETGYLPQQVTSYSNHDKDDFGCYGDTVGFERKLHRWVYGIKCKKMKDKSLKYHETEENVRSELFLERTANSPSV